MTVTGCLPFTSGVIPDDERVGPSLLATGPDPPGGLGSVWRASDLWAAWSLSLLRQPTPQSGTRQKASLDRSNFDINDGSDQWGRRGERAGALSTQKVDREGRAMRNEAITDETKEVAYFFATSFSAFRWAASTRSSQ